MTAPEPDSVRAHWGPVLFAVPDITDDEVSAVVQVLRSGWITTGSESDQLEAELSAYLGGAHVVAMSSCTAALETAAAHLALRPGSRVGVPTWTFISSALSFMKSGATPVLLDVEPDTLNVAPEALEAALDRGLDAVVLVHMGGVPVADAVHKLCQQADIPVIEDAAHALGASDERGPIGAAGNGATCFSFYATKNLTSAEGGALVTADRQFADFARSYRLHGLSLDAYARYRPGRPLEYDLVAGGIKANLPDVLAAFARAQLRRFPQLQARRRELVERYRRNLASIADIRPIPSRLVEGSADHLMLVVLPEMCDRDELRSRLSAEEIGTSVHFKPLHAFTWLRERAEIGPAGLSMAEALRTRVLSLPLHTHLTDRDVDRVCERLAAHLPACSAG